MSIIRIDDYLGGVTPSKTTSVQNAWDQAYAAWQALRGGIIQFGAGDYLIPNMVVEHSSIMLRGFAPPYIGGRDFNTGTTIYGRDNDAVLTFNKSKQGALRGGSINNICFRGPADKTMNGIDFAHQVSHMRLDNVISYDTKTAYKFGLSSLSNILYNCTARNFSHSGYVFEGLNHACALHECRSTSKGNQTGAKASVIVGSEKHSSAIKIIGGQYEAWGVKKQFDIIRANQMNMVGVYSEFKPDDEGVILCDIGSGPKSGTNPVRGFNATGFYFIGNGSGDWPFRIKNASSATIRDGFVSGFTKNGVAYIFNSSSTGEISGMIKGNMPNKSPWYRSFNKP